MHSYSIDGSPKHTVPTKGKAKNPTRPTNLKDMQENGWFPSVTEYLRMMSAPGLDAYKIREVIKACYHCPPIADEDIDTYSAHIQEKAGMDAGGAADLGTQIHESLERHFKEPLLWKPDELITMPNGAQVPCSEFVLPAVEKIKALGLSVVETEKVLVNAPYGYAGTTDVVWRRQADATTGILDYKSKRTKPGKPVEPTETHPVQIAAYIAAFWGKDWEYPIQPHHRGYNVYISTIEVGRVDIVEYDYATLKDSWEVFKHCLAIFRWRHFDARVKQ
jgi:hypothetical protein